MALQWLITLSNSAQWHRSLYYDLFCCSFVSGVTRELRIELEFKE